MSMTAERDDSRAVRPAVVAGMFYPGAPDALREAIAQAFRSPFGPGTLPVTQAGPRRLAGIVVPHAGYQYSGPCAACAYTAVARDGRPAAVVLLGVNHHGIGAPLAVSPAMHWQTPLGEMPVATALRERLLQRVAGVKADNRAHQQEHSLEVQVPFLQYLFGEVPILPISLGMPSLNAVLELGQALAALAEETDLLLIASTDFSHYIPHREAQRLDQLALERIAAIDPEGLLETVRTHGITMCGVLPVAAALATAQARQIRQADLLQYYTSGDITGDHRQVVGYGAAAFFKPRNV